MCITLEEEPVQALLSDESSEGQKYHMSKYFSLPLEYINTILIKLISDGTGEHLTCLYETSRTELTLFVVF